MRPIRTFFRVFLGLVLSLVALVMLFVAGLALRNFANQPGRVVYVGGPVVTMDEADTIASGIALEGDRIAVVGSEGMIRAWAESHDAEVVELEGRAVLPGFIDAHGHFPGTGIYAVFADLNSPPIGPVSEIDELIATMARHASERSEGEWVLGVGYDDTLLKERRHPTRHDLDRASSEHPIAIVHVSGHLASVNSLALERLGIDRDTPDPEGGLIRREQSGEPSGVLEETAMDPIQAMLTPDPIDGIRILLRGAEVYAEAGVTTAQSGLTPVALYQVLDVLSRLGLLPIRLMVWLDESAADALLAGEFDPPQRDPSAMLRVGAVKLIGDGSIQGYTGYLSEPYFVPPGDDPSYRGYPRIPREDLIEQVGRYHESGLQIAVHGNGDASIDDILDAYEAAQRAQPREDARHIIIHAQMTRDDQLDRMAALGIVPSFFSLHTFYWGDRHRQIFMGPERAAHMSPARSAQKRGVRFTIHADAPVVPMEPLRLAWSAVNRRTRSDFVVGPEERISPQSALRAVTIDAAWQYHEEQHKGSLEAGKLADLVVLSRSPLVDPEQMDEIEVLRTVVGGRTVYDADEG